MLLSPTTQCKQPARTLPLVSQVASYDDIGGEVADIARNAALSAMASAHVVVLVLDVAEALRSQKARLR